MIRWVLYQHIAGRIPSRRLWGSRIGEKSPMLTFSDQRRCRSSCRSPTIAFASGFPGCSPHHFAAGGHVVPKFKLTFSSIVQVLPFSKTGGSKTDLYAVTVCQHFTVQVGLVDGLRGSGPDPDTGGVIAGLDVKYSQGNIEGCRAVGCWKPNPKAPGRGGCPRHSGLRHQTHSPGTGTAVLPR